MNWLGYLSDVATIATAIVAVYAYGSYRMALCNRTIAVEKLLAKKSRPMDDSLTLEQIAGQLKFTTEQVLEAASRSKKIEGTTGLLGNERRLRYVPKEN